MEPAVRPSACPIFKVALDIYYGPLDLLLYLLRHHELDIQEISLARIAEQFREFLNTLQELHLLKLEVAGEFLVMAARLMEIKSRLLVAPQPDTADAQEEPVASLAEGHKQLVDQLLEYRKIKEAAELLERRVEAQLARYPRLGEEPAGPAQVTPLTHIRPVELWDLVAAFARILREIQPTECLTVQADDVPQQVYENEIVQSLASGAKVAFAAVFTPPYVRLRLIGLFLALLELIRRQVVAVENDAAGQIWLWLLPTAGSPTLAKPDEHRAAAQLAEQGS